MNGILATSQGKVIQRGILGIRVQAGQTVRVNDSVFKVLWVEAQHSQRSTIGTGRLAIVRDSDGFYTGKTIWSNQWFTEVKE